MFLFISLQISIKVGAYSIPLRGVESLSLELTYCLLIVIVVAPFMTTSLVSPIDKSTPSTFIAVTAVIVKVVPSATAVKSSAPVIV